MIESEEIKFGAKMEIMYVTGPLLFPHVYGVLMQYDLPERV